MSRVTTAIVTLELLFAGVVHAAAQSTMGTISGRVVDAQACQCPE
jgi:hypothetical protein